MRSILIALCAFVLVACSGSGSVIRPLDSKRAPTVYIEPITGDGYGITTQLESMLIRRGYDPVPDPAQASMRLRATYVFSAYDTRATVRISDTADGSSIYVGDGKNSGWGTLLNPPGAIAGCFERALDNLPAR